MNRSTAALALVLLVLASALLYLPAARPASATSPEREARDKLETLKKQLPEVITTWVDRRQRLLLGSLGREGQFTGSLRFVHLVNPIEAKIGILLRFIDSDGKPYPDCDQVIF